MLSYAKIFYLKGILPTFIYRNQSCLSSCDSRRRTLLEGIPATKPHAEAQRIAVSFSAGERARIARLIAKLMRCMA